MDVDRLAALALEFAQRMHTEDPADVAGWLHANTTEQDRWQLLFVQAAVGPVRRATFLDRSKWTVDKSVDDIAVERACRGEPLPLSRYEQAAAVRRLARRGVSTCEISRRLNVCRRQVQRLRHGQLRWAEGVA